MARVLIATPMLEGCFDGLSTHEVVSGEAGSDRDADALICDPTQVIGRDTLLAMPYLRLIAVAGAGADGIDANAARARKLDVRTVGEVLAETTADVAFGLIIAACRQMGAAEASLRAGTWDGWGLTAHLGQDVNSATLGLVGFGRIGQAVARRAEGFSMTVLHHTRTPTGREGWTEQLDELLQRSDIVSVHVPLTDATRKMIDRRRIALLKRTAVLVNTARGAVVDEDALAQALREGRLFAAGLDVYAEEPAVPKSLLAAPRAVLLPHIGSATLATRKAMLKAAADVVLAYFA